MIREEVLPALGATPPFPDMTDVVVSFPRAFQREISEASDASKLFRPVASLTMSPQSGGIFEAVGSIAIVGTIQTPLTDEVVIARAMSA